MVEPTKNAVVGRFQNKSGDDFLQLIDGDGRVVSWIDSSGQPQGQLKQGSSSVVSISNFVDQGTF